MLRTPYNKKTHKYKTSETGKSEYGHYTRFINNTTKEITVKITQLGDRISEIQESANLIIEQLQNKESLEIQDSDELKLTGIEIHNKRMLEIEKKQKEQLEKWKKQQEKIQKEYKEFQTWKNTHTKTEQQ